MAEQIYHQGLCEDFGQPIVPARTALGALLVKERLGLTDRETVEAIRENPYLQFFIGLEEFTQDKPFDASTMVDFRKRFGEEGVQQIADNCSIGGFSSLESGKKARDEFGTIVIRALRAQSRWVRAEAPQLRANRISFP